jgi:hypothetical protein
VRFRYLADPLFLVCFATYFVNRWLIKPHITGGFCHDYLNDLICIPFWLPPMLWLMRRTGCRAGDGPPQAHEILIPLLLWSLCFEVILPWTDLFHGLDRADPKDVLWYAVGAMGSAIFWRLWYGAP